MDNSNSLSNQLVQEIAQSKNNSKTAVGRCEPSQAETAISEDLVDTINQVFELFRINYHNQYYSAFSDVETLNHAKRLWLETLARFEMPSIIKGAKRAIETSEYLPTLNKMIQCCEGEPSHHGLPDVYRAYIEACQAPTPKSNYAWSHAAVYYAGSLSGWHFLAGNTQKAAFPIFERNYKQVCERVVNGEVLAMPETKALPEKVETPLSKKENRKRLKALRQSLKL